MWDKKCRLCLAETNLTPLFKNSEQINEYISVLFLTTGLKIEPNDGLPQKICETCTTAVNSAFNLRNRSLISEKQLLCELDLRNQENMNKSELTNDALIETEDKNIDTSEDCEENNGLRYEKENDSSDDNITKTKWLPVKKLTKKEKRQKYLNLVEGTFDPNGPVTCKVCKNTLSNWRCFLSHCKLHLGFNFMCEFCGKSFISSSQLNRHCRSHHDMKRELQCKHCSYLALDNTQLKLHTRRVHTGERPYICDICASSYHSRKCLVQHIESHRTESNIQCDSCTKVFKSHRALSRHRYSTHSHKRVQCLHCARVYTRKYLNVHIDKYHGELAYNTIEPTVS